MKPKRPKHSETEEAILQYLYDHPKEKHSTRSLASVLKDPLTPEEIAENIKNILKGTRPGIDLESSRARKPRRPEDVQKDIEALIVAGSVRGGERLGVPGNITHADIKLTARGEREAIEAKNRP
jgi:hypothetical protein